MQLIYKNEFGAFYKIVNSPNQEVEVQLVVDAIGVFMSRKDLNGLAKVIDSLSKPGKCEECGSDNCRKIWYTHELVDVCLKAEGEKLTALNDLVKGAEFILNMDQTLEKYRIRK